MVWAVASAGFFSSAGCCAFAGAGLLTMASGALRSASMRMRLFPLERRPLPGLQFGQTDGDAVFLCAENIERVRPSFVRLTATEQRLDEAGCQFLGANAIVLGGNGRCPAPLPREFDGNRFDLFRNPGAVNASECQHVVATGGDGADFVFFVGEHDCFEYSSVEISNGHNCIVRHWVSANQSLALQAGHRTIPNVNFSD